MSRLACSVEVGRLVAGPVERELRVAAHHAGVTLNLQKHMGLLDGVLLIEARGEAHQMERFMAAIKPLMERYKANGVHA